MIPYLGKGVLNFIDEFCDNLGGVRPAEKKIGPAIKLDIRRFDQNGFGIAHALNRRCPGTWIRANLRPYRRHKLQIEIEHRRGEEDAVDQVERTADAGKGVA